jgi:hypothetical protein
MPDRHGGVDRRGDLDQEIVKLAVLGLFRPATAGTPVNRRPRSRW